jgi:hypothetical protein
MVLSLLILIIYLTLALMVNASYVNSKDCCLPYYLSTSYLFIYFLVVQSLILCVCCSEFFNARFSWDSLLIKLAAFQVSHCATLCKALSA